MPFAALLPMNLQLSICIPTFNMGIYLEEALTQFVAQIEALPDPTSVEICISDNASTDDTPARVRTLTATTSVRLHYQRHGENQGPDANYMAVVAMAQGRYCWLFGADDTPTPGALERILAQLADGNIDIALHERVECDLSLQPLPVQSRIMALEERIEGGTAIFDGRSPAQLARYFACCNNIGGLYSYLSAIVVKRAVWEASPLDERFMGSAYSHAQRLCLAIAQGAMLSASPARNVYCRLGNDSFLQADAGDRHARRTLLDIAGYAAIARVVFEGDWRGRAVLSVLRRTHPRPLDVIILLYECLTPQTFAAHHTALADYGRGRWCVGLARAKVAASRWKRRLLISHRAKS